MLKWNWIDMGSHTDTQTVHGGVSEAVLTHLVMATVDPSFVKWQTIWKCADLVSEDGWKQ